MSAGSLPRLLVCTVTFLFVVAVRASAQLQADSPTTGDWGDQGNGTYANPVLPADFSDLDAITVGNAYYAISSTFQYSPGMAVLASPDLVNWQIIGHVVQDLTTISSAMNWDKMARPGRGIWAGSIRYHDKKYWVYFGTPDEGLFMSTASSPAGPWTSPLPVLATDGWDDPCPFWDDDGRLYLVATHFKPESPGEPYNIHLFELSSDGQRILPASDRLLHHSTGSEANKLYKIHHFYYHYYSEVRPEGRVAMMERSSSLRGPWQNKQLNHVDAALDKEPNQGGLIQLPSGKWWFFTHQGTGDWEGRAGVLLPVTWIDGWPILGKPGSDGIGTMVWRASKPIRGFPHTAPVATDYFRQATLRPEWEWNYQPRAGKWSLTERPGYLRLHAFRPLRIGDFSSVANILTQRSMRTRANSATVKLDLSGMAEGEEAGLVHYAQSYCTLAIMQVNGSRLLSYKQDGRKEAAEELIPAVMWLRSTWNFGGKSRFSYSVDGKSFQDFGSPCQLTWANYRGDRIGIYTDNPTGENGYVDVDEFIYTVSRNERPWSLVRLLRRTRFLHKRATGTNQPSLQKSLTAQHGRADLPLQ